LIFDRFHRATDSPSGTGLGLAIADSVVRKTQGSWSVGQAPLGGARMQVWWGRVPQRRNPSADSQSQTAGEQSTAAGTAGSSHAEHGQGAETPSLTDQPS
jgi:hypothetical protein